MAINNLSTWRKDTSWLAKFTADNEHYFTGNFAHAHLGDPGRVDEDAQWVCETLSNIPGWVGMAFQIIAITWKLAKNGDDKTYDLYYMSGKRMRKITIFGRDYWVPVYILFWGFVSDVKWYPPVKLNSLAPGPMLPTPGNLFLMPHLKALANDFRHEPAPAAPVLPQYGRRFRGNMLGERYLANINTMEIHDLDQEDYSPTGCQIDEIIDAKHDRPYNILEYAHTDGYDNCAKCLGGSTR